VTEEGKILECGYFVDTHDLKPILTKVRVVKMFNEAPKTIASEARYRLRALCARLLSVGLRDRGTQNIGMRFFVDTHDLKPILTKVRVVKMVNGHTAPDSESVSRPVENYGKCIVT
jgi:hypothetical protein